MPHPVASGHGTRSPESRQSGRNQIRLSRVASSRGARRLFARLEQRNMEQISSTPMLDRITSPEDRRSLSERELRALAEDILQFLVATVYDAGGELVANRGS